MTSFQYFLIFSSFNQSEKLSASLKLYSEWIWNIFALIRYFFLQKICYSTTWPSRLCTLSVLIVLPIRVCWSSCTYVVYSMLWFLSDFWPAFFDTKKDWSFLHKFVLQDLDVTIFKCKQCSWSMLWNDFSSLLFLKEKSTVSPQRFEYQAHFNEIDFPQSPLRESVKKKYVCMLSDIFYHILVLILSSFP